MSEIMSVRNTEIGQALEQAAQQYVVGRRSVDQRLIPIEDEKLELGILKYSGFVSEPPRLYQNTFKYCYVVSGMVEYLDIRSGATYSFRTGDVYVIPAGTPHALRSKPGTTILFVKSPPGEQQTVVPASEQVRAWLGTRVRTIRRDYSNDPQAPTPNSVKPATAVAIINDRNEILLLKRRDNEKWTMPGGTLEFTEDLRTCAVREVQEETGYIVDIIDLIGTYSDPQTVIAYSDGEVRREFTVLYSGQIVGGAERLDDESVDCQWVPLEHVPHLPLADSQKRRLENVRSYRATGKRFLQ